MRTATTHRVGKSGYLLLVSVVMQSSLSVPPPESDSHFSVVVAGISWA